MGCSPDLLRVSVVTEHSPVKILALLRNRDHKGRYRTCPSHSWSWLHSASKIRSSMVWPIGARLETVRRRLPASGDGRRRARSRSKQRMTRRIDDTSTGKLMEGVLAAFAQFDNDCRSDRTAPARRLHGSSDAGCSWHRWAI